MEGNGKEIAGKAWDTQLSLSQNIPIHRAVIVSIPQDIVLLYARRGKGKSGKVEGNGWERHRNSQRKSSENAWKVGKRQGK